MHFWVGNQHTKVKANQEESEWLSGFLTFEDSSNSFYMVNGKVGYAGTTTRRFYNFARKDYPAGLTAMAYRRALEKGFDVTFTDVRHKPCEHTPETDLEWLTTRKLLDGTPYQLAAVKRCLERTRGLLWLSTGSGKTEIACGLMKCVDRARWVFLAPEADLMLQGADRFEKRTGEQAGRIGDGLWDTDHRCVFATFQTLSRRLKTPDKAKETLDLLKSFQGCIVDEVHQLPANDFYKVALTLPNCYWRIGMSGTALERGDNRNMYIIGALGEIIFRVPPKDLMEAGHIAIPNIKFVPLVQRPSSAKLYNTQYKHQIVESRRRNTIITNLAVEVEKPGVVFVRYKKHAQILLEMIRDRGLSVEIIEGSHNQKMRKQIIEKLQWGDLDLVIATKVLQTGTDIPELRSAIMAAGGASSIVALQSCGRAMRVLRDTEGNIIKDSVTVYDIMDLDEKVVGPSGRLRATKQKTFQKHAEQRFQCFTNEGYPTIVLTDEQARRFGA